MAMPRWCSARTTRAYEPLTEFHDLFICARLAGSSDSKPIRTPAQPAAAIRSSSASSRATSIEIWQNQRRLSGVSASSSARRSDRRPKRLSSTKKRSLPDGDRIGVPERLVRKEARMVAAHYHGHAARAIGIRDRVRAARGEGLHAERDEIGIHDRNGFGLLVIERDLPLRRARGENAHG